MADQTQDHRAPISFMPSPVHPPMNLADAQAKLSQSSGPQYWRSLEELAGAPGFDEMLAREFPQQAPASWAALGRRDFMKLMGASLALAGLAGCARQPQEEIIPFIDAPENRVAGKPLFYATAFPMSGVATGVLAESNEGRPTKIEGNDKHPISRGTTDIWMQASVLGLWDPDRSQNVMKNGAISTFDEFGGAMLEVQQKMLASRGAGLRILTGATSSPSLSNQISGLLAAMPNARWHVWESVSQDNAREGARLAFGAPLQANPDFSKADVILSLDADFLLEDPARLRNARDFIKGRRVRDGLAKMNRLYVAESTHTITGAKADHRLPLRASQIEGLARSLAAQLGVSGFSGQGLAAGQENIVPAKWLDAVAKDLQSARGASLVVAGMNQPPAVHAIAHAINEALGNNNKTVTFSAPVETMPVRENVQVFTPDSNLQSLTSLVTDMNAGKVDTLLILGSNPVYNAPADLKFLDALKKVKTRIHSGAYFDETGEWSNWHIPEASYLETWGDARSVDGTVSLIQPLISPLFQAWSAHEILSLLHGGQRSSYDIVKSYWRAQRPGGDFEKFWQTALHEGVVPGTAFAPVPAKVRLNSAVLSPSAAKTGGMEIQFRPDPTIWDGTFSNNAWLQELPKPITKLTWDNTAQMSPKTADRLGVQNEDVVELKVGNATVQAPVWVLAGHPDDAVTVHLGYGRTRAGQLGTGIGFDAGKLRNASGMGFASGLQVTPTGQKVLLACTQKHHNMHGRDLVRETSFPEFQKNPGFAQVEEGEGGHGEGEHGDAGPSNSLEASGAHAGADQARAGSVAGRGASGEGEGAEEQPHDVHDEFGREGRSSGDLYRHGPEFNDRAKPDLGIKDHPSLYPEWQYKGYAWGMAVDTQSCIGCNACVVGCQSENNVATVGKNEVLRGRAMHWIRIDTYFRGEVENPETSFQPLMCMHCENAPCEPVCPVEATSHSTEGINEMTYNRCVGTRYCQNNCPYKVRRFNFLQYSEQDNPTIMLMHNPDVTVRSRGVMEKCNYCVQRVTEARIEADKDNRAIREGEIVTACQQACPTNAIIFGNLNDPNSRVTKLKKHDLNYGILTELNTQPRTTYLAKVQNPNPALKKIDIVLEDTPELPWEASR